MVAELIHRQHNWPIAVCEHLSLRHGHEATAAVGKRLENPSLAGAGRHPKVPLQDLARHVTRDRPTTVRQHKSNASPIRRDAGLKFCCFHD